MHTTINIQPDNYVLGERFAAFGGLSSRIVYSKMDWVQSVLHHAKYQRTSPFVLITHNSDYGVTENLLKFAKTVPTLKKWYAQNVECPPDPLVQAIPIGLENFQYFPEVEKIKKIRANIEKQFQTPTTPQKMLYVNFSFSTNDRERRDCRNLVTNSLGAEQYTDRCQDDVKTMQYSDWISDVENHHYVLCPRGNGIDTHRLWETLYLGRIPVVCSDTNNQYFKDLPILFVDSWDEVTPNLLESRLPEFSNLDLNMLCLDWWKSEILKTEQTL